MLSTQDGPDISDFSAPKTFEASRRAGAILSASFGST